MDDRIKELRRIWATKFHTIPHTKTFGELLDIAEELETENERLRGVIEKELFSLEYCAFNLTTKKKIENLPLRIIETTCSEDSLLISIRNLKQVLKQENINE